MTSAKNNAPTTTDAKALSTVTVFSVSYGRRVSQESLKRKKILLATGRPKTRIACIVVMTTPWMTTTVMTATTMITIMTIGGQAAIEMIGASYISLLRGVTEKGWKGKLDFRNLLILNVYVLVPSHCDYGVGVRINTYSYKIMHRSKERADDGQATLHLTSTTQKFC